MLTKAWLLFTPLSYSLPVLLYKKQLENIWKTPQNERSAARRLHLVDVFFAVRSRPDKDGAFKVPDRF